MKKNQRGGFSFIQILIILIVIALIGLAIVLIFKPSKVLEKSRDSQRFADMTTLSEAINQYLADGRDFESLVGPFSSIDIGFATDEARRDVSGNGWIPLNFKAISTGAPFNDLPIDPLNNSDFNYRLGVSEVNKSYEIECVFESPDNIGKHSTDGGNNFNKYELGTDLTIL